MKINITKNEYRLLLDVLSIADWVMNAYQTEDDPRTKPYKDLEQKFLAYAKEFGFGSLIVYDKELEGYFPTGEYEDAEEEMGFIDEFEEEVFWNMLCHRLAERDLIEEKGIDEFEKMEPVKRMIAEDEIGEKYNEEFVENGINNLRLSKIQEDDDRALH